MNRLEDLRLNDFIDFNKNHIQNCIFIHRMITKTQLEEQLKSLPEEFSIEDLIERLILLEKIETGVKESENNQVISEMALEEEIKKWFN